MKQLERLEILIGTENIKKIENKVVLIIGLGGVGGYATEAIARSGFKKIIIVDSDIIDISNLNRQLISLNSNIGLKKVDVMEKRIKDINDSIEVIKISDFILKKNINILFDNKIDYIIDACDTIETKIELIKESYNRNIKIISCMGTGRRMNPLDLEIKQLSKTKYDPLARVIRKVIKDKKIKESVMVVCSKELPKDMNSKIIGSNSFVPAISGLLCASYIVNDIVGE